MRPEKMRAAILVTVQIRQTGAGASGGDEGQFLLLIIYGFTASRVDHTRPHLGPQMAGLAREGFRFSGTGNKESQTISTRSIEQAEDQQQRGIKIKLVKNLEQILMICRSSHLHKRTLPPDVSSLFQRSYFLSVNFLSGPPQCQGIFSKMFAVNSLGIVPPSRPNSRRVHHLV